MRTGTREFEEGLVKEWRKGTKQKRKCAEGKSQERGGECEKWKMPRANPVWVRGEGIITAVDSSNFLIAKSRQSEFGPTGLDRDSIGSQAFIERPAWSGGAKEFNTRW